MPEQHGAMIAFVRFTGDDREFLDGGQAAVRRGDPFAGGFATPEREKFQARNGQSLAAPRNVNAKNIELLSLKFGKAGNGIKEMLEPAHVARSGVVLPTVNVNEEQRTCRLVDHFESRF